MQREPLPRWVIVTDLAMVIPSAIFCVIALVIASNRSDDSPPPAGPIFAQSLPAPAQAVHIAATTSAKPATVTASIPQQFKDVGTLRPFKMQLNDVGDLYASDGRGDSTSVYKVDRVLGDTLLVSQWGTEWVQGRPGPDQLVTRFFVKGVSVVGVVTGREIELPGRFAVTGTKPQGTSTYFVIEKQR